MASLYGIFARAAGTAVLFRRGPSKQVRLIGWDLTTHTFTPGQWLKGRIYERKSDLSPDGTKLVYYAADWRHTGGRAQARGCWRAVSTPPYLTAHTTWGACGAWDILSMFEADNLLSLGVYAEDWLEPSPGSVVPPELEVKARLRVGYFHRLADHDRQIRDGWIVREGDPFYRGKGQEPLVYRKNIAGAHSLQLTQGAPGSRREIEYALVRASGDADPLDADWAEVRGSDIYYSRGKKLFQIPNAARVSNKPMPLADFTDMAFEEIVTPEWARTWNGRER